MKDCNLLYLIKLAINFDIYSEIKTTTTSLVKYFDMSQQSVSRILISLEKDGLIKRVSSTRGIILKVEDKSFKELKKVNEKLSVHFNNENLVFHGTLKEGIGEGKYYISRPTYQARFKKSLHITPYEGTLNLQVDESVISKIKNRFKCIEIDGFVTKERSFSSLKFFKCRINDLYHGFVIFIDRTSHPDDIIEIISENYLREKIKGNKIKVEMLN